MQENQWTKDADDLLNSAQTSLHVNVDSSPLWKEAVSFYAEHSIEVIKTLLPASAIAYVVALFLQEQIQAVSRQIFLHLYSSMRPRGLLEYEVEMIPLQSLSFLKQWFLWACYCFAFIGICRLAERYAKGGAVETTENVFTPIREHPFRFLKSVTLFFLILALGFAATMVMIFGSMNIAGRFGVRKFTGPWITPIWVFVPLGFVSAVLVRWAFAVPLSAIQGLPFGEAMKASDRMTNHRMLALWLLVMESEIMGYLAYLAPGYLFYYLHLPATTLTSYAREGLALLLSATTQAPLMIALGLVLANRSESRPSQSLAAVTS